MNRNSTRVEIFLGDETTALPAGAINTFIKDTCGIEVIGPVQITYIDPPLSGGETMAYLLTYKIN